MSAIAIWLAVVLSLVGAGICVWLLIAPDAGRLKERLWRRLADLLSIEQVRIELSQAGLGSLPLAAWFGLRLAIAVITGLIAYAIFGVPVLAAVGAIAGHHLMSLALQAQRQRRRAQYQQALLDAIRYGAAVMAQGGSATDMLKALAQGGPPLVRPVFDDLASTEAAAPLRLRQMQEQIAEPLFDDLALALLVHWKKGAKLAPALSAITQDAEQNLGLRREAKALRSGVEASVVILSLLPLAFLFLLQLTAPMLLQPLKTPAGQLLLAMTVIWMLLGYRVLQQMAAPPPEERLRLRDGVL